MLNDIKKLKNPPTEINMLGRLVPEDNKNIVVIGTRQMSNYGKDVINCLVPTLVQRGFTIISGLAPGCDSYAQDVALRCGGRTIGVLGYGFDFINKDHNRVFITKVYRSSSGVIISPFARNTHPSKFSFIYRNSIMAALGNSILVVEARARSGVFYTVNAALDLGKDVYAVPGSIFNYNSLGTNGLIKDGCIVVKSSEDLPTF